jgi:hypothetical protein
VVIEKTLKIASKGLFAGQSEEEDAILFIQFNMRGCSLSKGIVYGMEIFQKKAAPHSFD